MADDAISPFDAARLRASVRRNEIAPNTGTQISQTLLMLLNESSAMFSAPAMKRVAGIGVDRVGQDRGNRETQFPNCPDSVRYPGIAG